MRRRKLLLLLLLSGLLALGYSSSTTITIHRAAFLRATRGSSHPPLRSRGFGTEAKSAAAAAALLLLPSLVLRRPAPTPRAFLVASAASSSSSSSFMEAVTPTYIEPEELLALLQTQRRGEEGPVKKLQVVDVRDDDYEGGRLPGAINVPSEEWYEEERVDALVRSLKGHDLVVFHCMLSQQRGPFCAKRFLARLSTLDDDADGDEGDSGSSNSKEEAGGGRRLPQVCVLRYGFQHWYRAYRKEIGMVVPCEDQGDEEEEEEDEEED